MGERESESTIQARIQARATELGGRLFRNTVAKAVAGNVEPITTRRVVTLLPGDYIVRRGRIIHAGLPVGSGDLIGWMPTIVNGQPLAVFTSVEVKSHKGRVAAHQFTWRRAVEEAGGAACIARSVADLDELARHTL